MNPRAPEKLNWHTEWSDKKSIKDIIKENPQAAINAEDYKEYLLVRLDTEQQKMFLEKKLRMEAIMKLSSQQREDILRVRENQEELKKRKETTNKEQESSKNEADALMEWVQKAAKEHKTESLGWILKETKISTWNLEPVIMYFEKIKENWGFFWILAWFALFILEWIKWIGEIFGMFKKDKIKNEPILENKIPNLNEKEVKEAIKTKIEGDFWNTLTHENKQSIEKALDSLNEEQLIKLYESHKKWELDLKTIGKIAPEITKGLFSPEQMKNFKEWAINKIKDSIKSEIERVYKIKIDDDPKKLKSLDLIVRKNVNLDDWNILIFKEIVEREQFRYGDLNWPLKEVVFNSWNIVLWLMTEWILPADSILAEIADKWIDVITLSVRWILWLSWKITFDNFKKYIENADERQKNLIIALLYRKGGLFLSLLWNISACATDLWVSLITKTSFKKSEAWLWLITWNLEKQVQNFEKLSKYLWVYEQDASWILDKSIKNVNNLKSNVIVMQAFEEASKRTDLIDDSAKIKYIIDDLKLKNIEWFDKLDPKKFSSLKAFTDEVANSFQKSITNIFEKWSINSKFWFWMEADVYKFNRKIEEISRAQKHILSNNILSKWWWRLKQAANLWEIWRLWDNLALHFTSAEQAKEWISKLNAIANNSPRLIKWLFDKLPIITVAWFAATSEKPFLDALVQESKYLIPIIWPLNIIMDSWWDWSSWYPVPLDVWNVWVWTALITIDGIFLWKAITEWAIKWTLPSTISKFMFKPIYDALGLVRWTWEVAYSLSKWVGADKLVKWIIEKSSKEIKPSRVALIAWLALIWYFWYKYLLWEDKIEKILKENWLNSEELKEQASKLSDKDKTKCILYILKESGDKKLLKWVEFEVKNNSLIITSKNPEIKGPWFMSWNDFDIYEALKLNPPKDEDFRYIWKDY